jgi:uncharacterized protein
MALARFAAGCSSTRLTEDECAFFRAARPCGLILFRRNCESPDQDRKLVDSAAEAAGVREVVVLHGVPFPHGEEDHAVYTVAAEPFRERRLAETDLSPLAGGVLDGVPGELVTRTLDGGLPVGVFITPTHPPGPDVDAAIRLLQALESCYRFDVDEAELEALAERLRQHYTELADRMEALGQEDSSVASRDFPEDRMYM